MENKNIMAGDTKGTDQNESVSGELIAESPSLDGNLWELNLSKSLTEAEWRDIDTLAARSSDPNPFFSPSLLRPAVKHLGHKKIRFMRLFRREGIDRTLCLFAPVEIGYHPLLRMKIMRVWSTDLAPLGTPLVRETEADLICNGFADCLIAAGDGVASAIHFEWLPKQSAFSETLYRFASLYDRLLRYYPFFRPGFASRAELEAAIDEISGKRRQRLHYARKQLNKLGTVSYRSASSLEDLEKALSDHLEIEDRGWKGKKGTSLASQDATRRFTSDLVKNLGFKGECRIYSLWLDEKAIASIIVFDHNGHFYPWKIAHDEAHASRSAGNLLVSYVNKQLADCTQFQSLDTLAGEDNATASRFWPYDREFTNLVIGLGDDARRNTLSAVWYYDWKLRLKRRAKRLLSRLA